MHGEENNAQKKHRTHLQQKNNSRASTRKGHMAGKAPWLWPPRRSLRRFSLMPLRRAVPDCPRRCPTHLVSNVNTLESVWPKAAQQGTRRVRSSLPLSSRGSSLIRPSLLPPPSQTTVEALIRPPPPPLLPSCGTPMPVPCNQPASPSDSFFLLPRSRSNRVPIGVWSHMRTLPYSVPATTTSLGFSLPHVTRISATAPLPRTTALSTTTPSAATCEPKNKTKNIQQGRDAERSTNDKYV